MLACSDHANITEARGAAMEAGRGGSRKGEGLHQTEEQASRASGDRDLDIIHTYMYITVRFKAVILVWELLFYFPRCLGYSFCFCFVGPVRYIQ
jgi:hypothetical protein